MTAPHSISSERATAPGEILELFKGGYLSIAETIDALEPVFRTPALPSGEVEVPNGATHVRRPEYITAWLFDRKSTMPIWLIPNYQSRPLPDEKIGHYATAIDGVFWRWFDPAKFEEMFVSASSPAKGLDGINGDFAEWSNPMSDRETWMDLIRNEYDPRPNLGKADYPGFEWDDGAGRIADAILAEQALLLRKHDDDWNIRKYIDFLRADEGDSVTLLCDNPDFNGQPNCAIECNGYWTNWQDRRFAADTLQGALELAYFECREWRANPPPEVSPDPLPAYADPNFKYDMETGTYRRTSELSREAP